MISRSRARRAAAAGAALVAPLWCARAQVAQLPAPPADTAGQGALAAAGASRIAARVRDLGPGAPGRLLRDALARPHLLVVPPDTGLTLGRGARAESTLVIVGGPVRLAATVRGDVIVLGDVFLRPGADVSGRVVALGGGVYNSTLARVGGDRLSYRDAGFVRSGDVADAVVLDAQAAPRAAAGRFTLPGVYGARIPSYTRVDGLAVSVGPQLAFDTGRVRVDLLATYRSQLGVVDPSVAAVAELSRRTTLNFTAGRTTATNDAWARRDLVNSIITFATGRDARNYYRADRAELTAARRYEALDAVIEPFVGALTERAWSAARDSNSSRPFSLLGRDEAREGMRRANPGVTGGRVTSLVAGARFERLSEAALGGRAETRVEQAVAASRGSRFTRATFDVALQRPNARGHLLVLLAHAAVAVGDSVPTQRHAYLGGGPTLPTLFLLSQGGTRLVWGEGRYTVPLAFVRLPFGGTPSFTGRLAAGAAGVDRLPALTPNVGLRLAVSGVRVDYVFDPRGRGRTAVGFGVGAR